MKRIKKLFGMLAATLVLAICSLFVPTYTANAAGNVDVTNNVSAANWVAQNELRVTYLSLGEGVIPAIGYGIIDNNAYTYAQDYIAINGKTVKEINTDTTLGASSWTYTVFPSSADAKYKLPVIIYVNNGKLEIKIHNNYVETLGGSVEITAKAGLYFENNNIRYEVTADKTFTVFGQAKPKETDITQEVSIEGWNVTGNAQELTYTIIRFPEGTLPDSVGYGVIDNASWVYLQEYITLNGTTIKEINEETDVSGYVFSTFPSTASDIYKVPVMVYENGNSLEIKFHNSYLQTLQGNLTITLKAGCYIIQGGTKYIISEDVSYVIAGVTESDITAEVSIEGWWVTGDALELTYTVINFPAGVLPEIIDYSIMDKAAWMYLQDFICINGKSIKEINEETDVSGYVFSTFPSTAADAYKVPVIVFENGNGLEIKIHNTYLETVDDNVEITVKEGLFILDGSTKYIVTEDVTKTVLQITETELTGISVNGWAAAGDAMELTYTRVQFPEGILPKSVDYDVMDTVAWMYLQEYIYFNDKSIKQINEETDVSDYVFSTFPSTEAEIYKVPIIIFENNGTLELKFHNAYLQTIEGEKEIIIKAGLYILIGATKYVVNEDICYQLSGDIWADKNAVYTVTYYVNGEVYGEVEEYPYKSVFVLREDVTVDAGYEFSGWEYPETTVIIQNMEIHGYVKPIRYTITYHLNGGINASVNPIVYYVTDGEVVLKDATKEGAIFKGWYTTQDYTQKVEKLSPDNLGNIQLYALFEGGATKNKGGCGSVAGMQGLLVLAGVAILIKKKNDE